MEAGSFIHYSKTKNFNCMKAECLHLFLMLYNHLCSNRTISTGFKKYCFLYLFLDIEIIRKKKNLPKYSSSVSTLHCFCSWYGGITYLPSVDERTAYSLYEGALSLPTVTYLRQIFSIKLCLTRNSKGFEGRWFFLRYLSLSFSFSLKTEHDLWSFE